LLEFPFHVVYFQLLALYFATVHYHFSYFWFVFHFDLFMILLLIFVLLFVYAAFQFQKIFLYFFMTFFHLSLSLSIAEQSFHRSILLPALVILFNLSFYLSPSIFPFLAFQVLRLQLPASSKFYLFHQLSIFLTNQDSIFTTEHQSEKI
jgi:hypothetical protein